MFLRASRRGSGDSTARFACTMSMTRSGIDHAKSRSAQPMALRMKKLPVGRVGEDDLDEAIDVRLVLAPELMEDRDTTDPAVRIGGPLPHHRDPGQEADHSVADHVHQSVHAVPPAVRHDHLAQERQRRFGQHVAMAHEDVVRDVVELALREHPQPHHEALQVGLVHEGQRAYELLRGGLALWFRHTEEGGVVLHVHGHCRRLGRVGHRPERRTNGIDGGVEVASRAHRAGGGGASRFGPRRSECPPSTPTICPVIHFDSGPQRKRTMAATSSISPNRPSGVWLR